MAGVSLPLTFQNSFWTQGYRKGLEVLYGQLEQVLYVCFFLPLTSLGLLHHKGVAENAEIVEFIRVRFV